MSGTRLLAVLSVASLLAGCGSGGSSSSGPLPAVTTAQATLSSTSFTFAATNVGSSAATQTAMLTNGGNAALLLSAITLSDTADYKLNTTCLTELLPATSCTLSVTFQPAVRRRPPRDAPAHR